jgi:hypothetical protein
MLELGDEKMSAGAPGLDFSSPLPEHLVLSYPIVPHNLRTLEAVQNPCFIDCYSSRSNGQAQITRI